MTRTPTSPPTGVRRPSVEHDVRCAERAARCRHFDSSRSPRWRGEAAAMALPRGVPWDRVGDEVRTEEGAKTLPSPPSPTWDVSPRSGPSEAQRSGRTPHRSAAKSFPCARTGAPRRPSHAVVAAARAIGRGPGCRQRIPRRLDQGLTTTAAALGVLGDQRLPGASHPGRKARARTTGNRSVSNRSSEPSAPSDKTRRFHRGSAPKAVCRPPLDAGVDHYWNSTLMAFFTSDAPSDANTRCAGRRHDPAMASASSTTTRLRGSSSSNGDPVELGRAGLGRAATRARWCSPDDILRRCTAAVDSRSVASAVDDEAPRRSPIWVTPVPYTGARRARRC